MDDRSLVKQVNGSRIENLIGALRPKDEAPPTGPSGAAGPSPEVQDLIEAYKAR